MACTTTRSRPALLLALLIAEACGSDPAVDGRDRRRGPPPEPPEPTESEAPVGGNVLIVLVDDLGVDKVGAYGIHDLAPATPTIDALAADGVLFRNAWSNPTCSPTRAALLTGRHARRTGVGRWVMPWEEATKLDPDEVLIPEVLGAAGYADAALGKWHLNGFTDNPDAAIDPLLAGFTWFEGTLANPDNSLADTEDDKGYAYWEKSSNGEVTFETEYLTTSTTDDALARLAAMPEPWFVYVAYNAPHAPLHVPPATLTPEPMDPLTTTPLEAYDAMATALDAELARLLDGMSPAVRDRTTIVFLGDNGTPDHAILPPQTIDRSKGTVFEGGVNVPMIVTGPAVAEPGTESLALVSVVDVLPTLAELAGVDLATVLDPRTDQAVRLDGVSFLDHLRDPAHAPTPDRNYTSMHFPNGPPPYEWEVDALRDDRFKVVHDSVGDRWEFYEYVAPFDEGPDLLLSGEPLGETRQEAYDRLAEELEARMAALPFGP